MNNTSAIAKKPFEYEIIDDFLEEKEFKKLCKFYESLKFKEIHSDLFRFTQSNELNFDSELNFLKSELDKIFIEKIRLQDLVSCGAISTKNVADISKKDIFQIARSKEDIFYTIFASLYRKDDFLLCHDDMIDERLYAFILYLDDFDSGSLILYENDCVNIHREIQVRKNRLAFFEVGDKSYHEVARCHKDGRKAITGWINSRTRKNVPQEISKNYKIEDDIETFELDLEIPTSDFLVFEFDDIAQPIIEKTMEGPFINRRVFKLKTDVLYVPQLTGFDLIHTEYLEFDESSYILCNDIVNLQTENILDLYLFECEKDNESQINYINDKGECAFSIGVISGHMILGERQGFSICVHTQSHPFKMKHFIYQKKLN